MMQEKINELLEFFSYSKSMFHATEWMVNFLEKHGFRKLDESSDWNLKPGEKVYFTRQGASLIAGVIGSAKPSEKGFRITAAHTDYPGLKLKPHGAYITEGYIQTGVEYVIFILKDCLHLFSPFVKSNSKVS